MARFVIPGKFSMVDHNLLFLPSTGLVDVVPKLF
jgi:hypothetical protein